MGTSGGIIGEWDIFSFNDILDVINLVKTMIKKVSLICVLVF